MSDKESKLQKLTVNIYNGFVQQTDSIDLSIYSLDKMIQL